MRVITSSCFVFDLPNRSQLVVTSREGADWIQSLVIELAVLRAEVGGLRFDASLGQVALRYIDRLSDPCDDCDPLERSVGEFVHAFDEVLNTKRPPHDQPQS